MLCPCSKCLSTTPFSSTKTDVQSIPTEYYTPPSHSTLSEISTIDGNEGDKAEHYDDRTESGSEEPSPALSEKTRSLSWPESLCSTKLPVQPLPLSFPFAPTLPILRNPPSTVIQVGDKLLPSPKDSELDKNQRLVFGANLSNSVSDTTSSVSPFFTPNLHQQTLNQSSNQVLLSAPMLYQMAAAGRSVEPLQRHVITPILAVLPSSNFNAMAATGLQASSQSMLFNPSLVPQTSLSALQEDSAPAQGNNQTKRQSDCTTPSSLPSPIDSLGHSSALSPTRTLASLMSSEMTPQYVELRTFAEEFKTKRIRLGYTQGAVGQSLAQKGYNNFAQSTISRFEQMQLSPTNAAAIKLVLEKWLHDTEFPDSQSSSVSSTSALPYMNSRKRKKRAVFTAQTRSDLEEFFKQNSRPNRQFIENVASELDLLPEEVRVWFCNKRQKLKDPHCVQNAQSMSDHESTTSSINSPSSLYNTHKTKSPSPSRTAFTIEELSKSSSSTSTTTHSQSTSTMNFSSLGMLRPLSTPGLFPVVVLNSSQSTFGPNSSHISALPIAQTTA